MIINNWADSQSIFLDVENNSKNVETKFRGRRISVYEVIKSINVNFLFFWSIYFIRLIFAFLLFLRVSTGTLWPTQKEMTYQ